jgi:hypothetical protein
VHPLVLLLKVLLLKVVIWEVVNCQLKVVLKLLLREVHKLPHKVVDKPLQNLLLLKVVLKVVGNSNFKTYYKQKNLSIERFFYATLFSSFTIGSFSNFTAFNFCSTAFLAGAFTFADFFAMFTCFCFVYFSVNSIFEAS